MVLSAFATEHMARAVADAGTIRGRYECIDHTADIGIHVKAATMEELFAMAAAAVFDLMADLSHIETVERLDIELKADSLEELFVSWLNELIFRAEARGMFFSRFEVDAVAERSLRASVWGEPYNECVHTVALQVKAATYHQLEIVSAPTGCSARVIFDV